MVNKPKLKRHQMLAEYVPEIYQCATTGNKVAWIAIYDQNGLWGESVKCQLEIVDEPDITKIIFHGKTEWYLTKKRLRPEPPVNIGIILEKPKNDPIHIIEWFNKKTLWDLFPSEGDCLHLVSHGHKPYFISAEWGKKV